MSDNLVPLAVFPNSAMAQICKSYLTACGILCFIFDEHITGYGMGYGPQHSGGIRVMVRAEDAEEARTLLRDNPDIDCPETTEEEEK